MRRAVTSALVVVASGAVVVLILLSNAPRGPLTGPAAHPWASFAPGTWVEMSVVIGERRWTERWEVVAADGAGVRLRTTVPGRPPDEQVIATVPEAYADEGVETLTLAGRAWRCRRQTCGAKRRWIADELPAWPVREEDEEGKTELIRVGERVGPRACMVFETRMPDGSRAVRWKALEVPGHIAREVRTTEIGEARVEVTSFGR